MKAKLCPCCKVNVLRTGNTRGFCSSCLDGKGAPKVKAEAALVRIRFRQLALLVGKDPNDLDLEHRRAWIAETEGKIAKVTSNG